VPFPLVHVDTGHNFEETMIFRDDLVKEHGATLIVGSVQESIDSGRVQEETGYYASRNKLQTVTLLDTIEKHKIDCAIGGGRRDEEKARAKERVFSHRDEFGQWDPKNAAAGTVEHLQRQEAPGRALPRLPHQQLDGDGRVAVHPAGDVSRSRASTSAMSAKCSNGTA
jgi:3'-phosphoadenosine 5'-phosphosulfate sulfotransferase (PAPS reductase)/FAD synthetase